MGEEDISENRKTTDLRTGRQWVPTEQARLSLMVCYVFLRRPGRSCAGKGELAQKPGSAEAALGLRLGAWNNLNFPLNGLCQSDGALLTCSASLHVGVHRRLELLFGGPSLSPHWTANILRLSPSMWDNTLNIQSLLFAERKAKSKIPANKRSEIMEVVRALTLTLVGISFAPVHLSVPWGEFLKYAIGYIRYTQRQHSSQMMPVFPSI